MTTMKGPMILFMLSIFPLYSCLSSFSSLYSSLYIWELTTFKSCPMELIILKDSMGLFYSFIVLFISSNVLKFSKIYMSLSQMKSYFTPVVLLFIASMNVLIFFPNMITLLLGWDGLGLSSFILVAYYNNMRSLAGALLTAITNRIGDVCLLSSIALLYQTGSWNMSLTSMSMEHFYVIILIILACMTKSAQMPFSTWLPAAMAAPTPVSALVHSSTLVTAGVFLLIRFFKAISNIPGTLFFLLWIGLFTCILSSLTALMETDMKKIIALSTLSQLGFMVSILGSGLPLLAYLHMCAHAMFKAQLFLCCGNIINSYNHSQDSRKICGSMFISPNNSSALLIALSSMCGVSFLSGYHTKHIIMNSSLSNMNYITSFCLLLSIALTIAYSFKLMLMSSLSFSSQKYILLMSNSHSDYPIILMSLMTTSVGAMMMYSMSPFMNIDLSYNANNMIFMMMLTGFSLYAFTSQFNKSLNSKLSLLISMINMVKLSLSQNHGLCLNSAHIFSSIDCNWLESPLAGDPMDSIFSWMWKLDSISNYKYKNMFSLLSTSLITMSLFFMSFNIF